MLSILMAGNALRKFLKNNIWIVINFHRLDRGLDMTSTQFPAIVGLVLVEKMTIHDASK